MDEALKANLLDAFKARDERQSVAEAERQRREVARDELRAGAFNFFVSVVHPDTKADRARDD